LEAGYRSSGGLARRLLRCISRGAMPVVPFGTGGARHSKQAYDGMGSQDMWFIRTSEAKPRKREAIKNHLLNPIDVSTDAMRATFTPRLLFNVECNMSTNLALLEGYGNW